jgi:uncharacterized protein
MLLEFRLRNYRSFRDEATLSLIASPDKALLEENTAATDIPALPRAVRSAAVYGPNAGGKTTLLRALLLMRGVVVESAALKPDQTYNVQNFMLDETSRDAPTLFEVTVLLDGVRHQYGFEFTSERIIKEWLLVYHTARPQRWFNRVYDPAKGHDSYEFSAHLAGQKRVWQEATRPNSLFLSMAVQLNSESLQPLFQWFSTSLNVFLDGGHIPHEFSTGMIEAEKSREAIRAMLTAADFGIADIAAKKQKGIQQSFQVNLTTGESESVRVERDVLVPKFQHEARGVTAEFDYHDESQGTQKLYALAGPILDIIDKGYLLVIDELESSLHPLLVRQIVTTFNDPAINTKGAQLIFSTHDSSLLDARLLRRDQIWFAEKDESQSSTLTPLSDFSARKDEAFEKGYLSGRYGGVPVLESRLLPTRAHGKR